MKCFFFFLGLNPISPQPRGKLTYFSHFIAFNEQTLMWTSLIYPKKLSLSLYFFLLLVVLYKWPFLCVYRFSHSESILELVPCSYMLENLKSTWPVLLKYFTTVFPRVRSELTKKKSNPLPLGIICRSWLLWHN